MRPRPDLSRRIKGLEILNAANIVTIIQIGTILISIYYTYRLINLHKAIFMFTIYQ